MMNKKLILSAASAAVLTVSCVSMYKGDGSRKVAGDLGSEMFNYSKAPYREKFEKMKDDTLDFSDQRSPEQFSEQVAASLSVGGKIPVTSGLIITDNEMAFQAKLNLVKKAKKSIRMVYFIYGNDQTSSAMNQALIGAANSGVSVTLLVDFITNYSKIDLFEMLSDRTNGKIKIQFYNFPQASLMYDVNYLTLPCPDKVPANANACQNAKEQTLAKMSDPQRPSQMTKLFLTGLYAKNPAPMMMALLRGAQIDPNLYTQQAESADKEISADELKELGKIVAGAALGNLGDKIKLSIALSMHGQALVSVVNEIQGRLPLKTVNKYNHDHEQHWDHLTDYTHHKLLVVDGDEFILGGRNIEDSYHMNNMGPKGKYVFMDTDFLVKTQNRGAEKVEASFDAIAFGPMSASIEHLRSNLYNELMLNLTRSEKSQPSASELALNSCKESPDLVSCLDKSLKQQPSYQSLQSRMAHQEQEMNKFASGYKNKEIQGMTLSSEDKGAQFYYLQNTTVFKNDRNRDNKADRQFGSRIGSEHEYGKNIQAAWIKGLENICRISREEKTEKRVIFHTAYLLLPSNIIHQFAKMMNGDYGDCSKVRISLLTNSPETTDLAPINILARYQFASLFNYYTSLEQYASDFQRQFPKTKFYHPKFEYYEYNVAAGTPLSLHTKTTLIGNDLIIGSANADVRSYYMDTNNAMMIRNATALNKQYIQFVDSIISAKKVSPKMDRFVRVSLETLKTQNNDFLQAGVEKYKQQGRLPEARFGKAMQAINQAGETIYNTTEDILQFRKRFSGLTENSDHFKNNTELNDAANQYDGLFKVF